MSYIPKYILKRMVPMDAIKLVGDSLEINAVNVISPLSIDNMPTNISETIENYVEFKIDGKDIPAADKKKVKLVVGEGDNLKSFTLNNIKEFEGVVIPVGGKMQIIIPVQNIKKGEEHTFDVNIKTDHPFNLQVVRTVN